MRKLQVLRDHLIKIVRFRSNLKFLHLKKWKEQKGYSLCSKISLIWKNHINEDMQIGLSLTLSNNLMKDGTTDSQL
jgi:hypothetical protein